MDATIIDAQSSTKNENQERDPEMHQTKKGNQWYFGMKAHVGFDSQEGIVHSVRSTVASVSDVHMLPGATSGRSASSSASVSKPRLPFGRDVRL